MSTGIKSFISNLRKKRIIEILAAFIGGGWLIIEFVDRILVAHYHFPDKTIDITFITLLCALFCTLIWRWFSGWEKPRKFKLELVIIPLLVLITVLMDINLLVHLKGPESETFPPAKWKNSIAVLPFVDMSPQKDQDWFCDGITDEIIGRLSNISELKVPARTSVFFFKGKERDVREIGKRLGVATVLEGSIQKVETKLRARVQLINIADGFHVWSEEYDRELRDIFAIQDEIALAVADKLKLTLLSDEKVRLVKRHTANPMAYEAYLKGRYYMNKRTRDGMNKGRKYFERAIEIDPIYAQAYAGLADYYGLSVYYANILPEDGYAKEKVAVLRALEIDEENAEAHASLGLELEFEFDWPNAERELKRAIELNPNLSSAHSAYGSFLAGVGRFNQVLKEIRRAQELDPLSTLVHAGGGFYLFMAHEYDLAIEQARKALELDPDYAIAHLVLGAAYRQKGILGEAIVECQEAVEHSSGITMTLSALGSAYASAGKKSEALNILGQMIQLSKERYISALDMTLIYTSLGEKDKALEWMERAYEEHSGQIIYAKVDPRLDPLRSDPRFQGILRRMNFPE